MLDKFFGKPDMHENQEPVEENRIAGITYFVDQSGEIQVDVELHDYSEESVDGLGQVLTALSMDNSYLQTVQMIQATLENEGEEEALLRIYNHLATNPNDKAIRIYKEKQKNKPCIRPSEML